MNSIKSLITPKIIYSILFIYQQATTACEPEKIIFGKKKEPTETQNPISK